MPINAKGLMSLARGAGSYSCKASSLIDLVDNFTSPQVLATEVDIRFASTKSARGDEKAKVHNGRPCLSCVYGEAQKIAVVSLLYPLTVRLYHLTMSPASFACSDGLFQEGHRRYIGSQW